MSTVGYCRLWLPYFTISFDLGEAACHLMNRKRCYLLLSIRSPTPADSWPTLPTMQLTGGNSSDYMQLPLEPQKVLFYKLFSCEDLWTQLQVCKLVALPFDTMTPEQHFADNFKLRINSCKLHSILVQCNTWQHFRLPEEKKKRCSMRFYKMTQSIKCVMGERTQKAEVRTTWRSLVKSSLRSVSVCMQFMLFRASSQ